jgi:hypothetical protein
MNQMISKLPKYKTLANTIKRDIFEFGNLKNVHHLGISKKIENGILSKESCVTFYVTHKHDVPIGKNFIPPLVKLATKNNRGGFVRTDVVEIKGEPKAFSLRGGNIVVTSDQEFGTVGLVFTQGNFDYLVTCAHVVLDPGTNPGPIAIRLANGGLSWLGLVIAVNDLMAPRVLSDAALVRLPRNTVEPGKFKNTDLALRGYTEIADNDPRIFYYVTENSTFQLKWTARVPECAGISVDDVSLRYCSFVKLSVLNGSPASGHSGAVVFCQSNNGLLAAGLLFGGVTEDNEVWVHPAKRCVDSLF